ncbi:MAG: GNAT family N-acetyltransferase [Candidatus Poseidoniaceae archaeon]|jgi:GNAT superfamily N-acetyltransferase|nr:GNAT family N-acetyltransferase [Candidatus Poseidoniaceae archaeon]
MPIVNSAGPDWQPTSGYYDCRFAVLREPLGFSRGAEILADDYEALHSWIEIDGMTVAVGRAHLIPLDSDGSQADHAGPGAVKCPAFGPLLGSENRPAIQIRQMGTLPDYQRKGLAAKVLAELEEKSVETFGAIVGLLQAREHAIPFYKSQGWEIIDEPYDVGIIGPHRSMKKQLH